MSANGARQTANLEETLMSVTFAAVSDNWQRLSISRAESLRIRKALEIHGRNGCSSQDGLPVCEVIPDGETHRVVCLFFNVLLHFICDPIARRVRVVKVGYAPLRDRDLAYGSVGSLWDGEFVSRRDRVRLAQKR